MESFMQKYKIKKSVVGYIFLDIDTLIKNIILSLRCADGNSISRRRKRQKTGDLWHLPFGKCIINLLWNVTNWLNDICMFIGYLHIGSLLHRLRAAEDANTYIVYI
jgi:hypothetical protein